MLITVEMIVIKIMKKKIVIMVIRNMVILMMVIRKVNFSGE